MKKILIVIAVLVGSRPARRVRESRPDRHDDRVQPHEARRQLCGIDAARRAGLRQPQSWAALPDRKDMADVLPGGDVQDRQATRGRSTSSSCIPPRSSAQHWNQSLDDDATNRLTDTFVLRGQASVFNSCCKDLRAALSPGDALFVHGQAGRRTRRR